MRGLWGKRVGEEGEILEKVCKGLLLFLLLNLCIHFIIHVSLQAIIDSDSIALRAQIHLK